MRRQRNSNHVIWGLRRAAIVLRMKLDAHRRCIDDNAKVAIVRRIVALQRQRVVDLVRRSECAVPVSINIKEFISEFRAIGRIVIQIGALIWPFEGLNKNR